MSRQRADDQMAPDDPVRAWRGCFRPRTFVQRAFAIPARVVFAAFWLALAAPGEPPETPTAGTTAAPTATATPTPVVIQHAPAGVLYLTEDTTVRLEHGMRGVAAGTEVRLLKTDGDLVEVADGEGEFSVKKAHVTDNLAVADTIRKRAAAIEANDDEARQQQEAVLIQQQRDEIEFLRTHPLATPTPTPGS